MRVLASIAFYGVIGLLSLLSIPVGLVSYILFRFTGSVRARRLARTLNWAYGRISVWLMHPIFRIRRINMDEAKKLEPCVIVCNHESILDLYMLGAQNSRAVCPVTKLWPFRLLFPFAPAMLAAGYVNAEGKSPEEIAALCKERKEEGCSLVFYPEGHRSLQLGKFHVGAFRFALEEKLPLIPMRITGSGRAIPAGSWLVNPGEITVEMFPAIMPDEFDKFRSSPLPHRAFMKHVRKLYSNLEDEDEV